MRCSADVEDSILAGLLLYALATWMSGLVFVAGRSPVDELWAGSKGIFQHVAGMGFLRTRARAGVTDSFSENVLQSFYHVVWVLRLKTTAGLRWSANI